MLIMVIIKLMSRSKRVGKDADDEGIRKRSRRRRGRQVIMQIILGTVIINQVHSK